MLCRYILYIGFEVRLGMQGGYMLCRYILYIGFEVRLTAGITAVLEVWGIDRGRGGRRR